MYTAKTQVEGPFLAIQIQRDAVLYGLWLRAPHGADVPKLERIAQRAMLAVETSHCAAWPTVIGTIAHRWLSEDSRQGKGQLTAPVRANS